MTDGGDDPSRDSGDHDRPTPSDSGPAPVEPPDAPAAATRVFGDRLPLAERFARHLANTGTTHGLIGPREVPRLWDRHLLNCAVVAEVIPHGSRVIDVGSGAGLPNIALAIARPDLTVTLVEPMERRTAWLSMVCADLALESVDVERARAEELHGRLHGDVVTARAVAALDKLLRWCLPLARPGGRVVALKGSSAEREIAEAGRTVRRLGGLTPQIQTCGDGIVDPPTRVVVVERAVGTGRPAGASSRPPRHRSGRG